MNTSTLHLDRSRPRPGGWRTQWVHLAVLPPVAFVLWMVSQSGVLPDNDYWGFIGQMFRGDHTAGLWEGWLVRANEHILFIPKLIFAINIWLSSGSNVALGLIAVVIVLAQYLILWRLLPADVRACTSSSLVVIALLGFFLFTPRAAHNWFLGMSGVSWFSANLFAVIAIAAMCRVISNASWVWWIVSMTAGLMATLSYSTGLTIWPVLALMIGVMPTLWRFRLSTWIVAVVMIGWITFSFERPSHHPEWVLDLGKISKALLVFLSNVVGNRTLPTTLSHVVGAAAMVAALIAAILAMVKSPRDRQELLPWLALMAYAAANGLIAAMSRGGFGEAALTASRYAGLQGLFWAGLLISWWLLSRHRGRSAGVVIAVVAAAMIINLYRISASHVEELVARAQGKAIAALALNLDIRDDEVIRLAVTPAPVQIWSVLPVLRRTGHVPFDAAHAPCVALGDHLVGQMRSDIGSMGRIVSASVVADGSALRFAGQLPRSGETITCMAVVNQGGIVRGVGLADLPAPDGSDDRNHEYWIAYAVPQAEDSVLTIAATVGDGQWYPVANHSP